MMLAWLSRVGATWGCSEYMRPLFEVVSIGSKVFIQLTLDAAAERFIISRRPLQSLFDSTDTALQNY